VCVAEAPRDFLVDFDHPDVAFGEIVSNGTPKSVAKRNTSLVWVSRRNSRLAALVRLGRPCFPVGAGGGLVR